MHCAQYRLGRVERLGLALRKEADLDAAPDLSFSVKRFRTLQDASESRFAGAVLSGECDPVAVLQPDGDLDPAILGAAGVGVIAEVATVIAVKGRRRW